MTRPEIQLTMWSTDLSKPSSANTYNAPKNFFDTMKYDNSFQAYSWTVKKILLNVYVWCTFYTRVSLVDIKKNADGIYLPKNPVVSVPKSNKRIPQGSLCNALVALGFY